MEQLREKLILNVTKIWSQCATKLSEKASKKKTLGTLLVKESVFNNELEIADVASIS